MSHKEYFFLSKVVSIIMAFVIGILISLNLIMGSVDEAEKFNIRANSYYSVDYDFKLNSPSYNEIKEIKKLDSVDKVFYYYELNAYLKSNDNDIYVNADFSTSVDFYASDFNDKRVIEMSKIKYNNYIYIENTVKDKLGINLNDELNLTFNGKDFFTFIVQGIYLDSNNMINPKVYFHYSNDVKDFVKSTITTSLVYKEALIKAEYQQYTKCLNDLTHFGPEGLMKNKSDFNSEDEYNNYVQEFRENDYSNSIVKISDFLNSSNIEYARYNNVLLRTFIFLAIIIIVFFLILYVNVIIEKKFNDKKVNYNGLPPISLTTTLENFSTLGVLSFISLLIGVYVAFFCITNTRLLLFDYRSKVVIFVFIISLFSLLLYLVFLKKIVSIISKINKK